MKKAAIVILFAFLAVSSVQAQLEKILHQSFDLTSINNITLDLYGEYEIEKWAGNSILTETSVQVYDASIGIFKHFVESGRYGIDANLDEESIALVSKDKKRTAIRTKKGECYEFVKVRIFVPDDFKVVDQGNLVRNVPTLEATTSKNNKKEE